MCLVSIPSESVTSEELSEFADAIWAVDVNRAAPADYEINLQMNISDGDRVDQSPER